MLAHAMSLACGFADRLALPPRSCTLLTSKSELVSILALRRVLVGAAGVSYRRRRAAATGCQQRDACASPIAPHRSISA
eukprot:354954-Chlamydomonas_euryale.AAC.6